LAELLAIDDHRVDTAGNGALALDRLREHTYDLIVSDLRMPGLDGPGFYHELKRQHPRFLARIVFLTGDTLSPELRAFLERTGATAHRTARAEVLTTAVRILGEAGCRSVALAGVLPERPAFARAVSAAGLVEIPTASLWPTRRADAGISSATLGLAETGSVL